MSDLLRLSLRALSLSLVLAHGLSNAAALAQQKQFPRVDRSGDVLPAHAIACTGTIRQHDVGGPIIFSPDGKILAAPGNDDTVRLREADTGKDIRRLAGHEGTVWSLAFSANGKWLVSGSEDRTVRLWEVETGREVRVFRGHTWAVYAVALTPDGKTIVSCGGHAIRIWDAESGKEVHRIVPPRDNTIWKVVLSPDGKHMAAQYHTGPVRVWESSTLTELPQFAETTTERQRPVFLPDGKTLLSIAGNGTVTFWELATGKELRQLKDAGWCAALSPDGKFLAAGIAGVRSGCDVPIRLWDVRAGKEVCRFRGHQNTIASLAISPDRATVVSLGGDGTLRRWDVASGDELDVREGHQNAVTTIAFSPDGKFAASGSADGTIRFWDPRSGKQLSQFQAGREVVRTIAFARNGKILFSHNLLEHRETRVRCWDANTGGELRPCWFRNSCLYHMAYCPTRDIVALAGAQSVELLNASNGAEVSRPKGDREHCVQAIALSPDGKLLATTNCETGLRVYYRLNLWDADSGRELWQKWVTFEALTAVAFSPDGKMVAAAGSTLGLWDCATGKELGDLGATEKGRKAGFFSRSFDCMNSAPTGLAFSPDGRLLAMSGAGNTILLWDVPTRRLRSRFTGHAVSCMAFSPDGKLLATGGRDTLVIIWDVAEIKQN